jgi:hypothetical protein
VRERERTLSEEHGLRVLENRMVRRRFGAKREEAMGRWKLCNEEIHNMYSCLL